MKSLLRTSLIVVPGFFSLLLVLFALAPGGLGRL